MKRLDLKDSCLHLRLFLFGLTVTPVRGVRPPGWVGLMGAAIPRLALPLPRSLNLKPGFAAAVVCEF